MSINKKIIDKQYYNISIIRTFKNILNISSNLLIERLYSVYDYNDDGGIEFDDFVNCLSALSHKASFEEKITCIINFSII